MRVLQRILSKLIILIRVYNLHLIQPRIILKPQYIQDHPNVELSQNRWGDYDIANVHVILMFIVHK